MAKTRGKNLKSLGAKKTGSKQDINKSISGKKSSQRKMSSRKSSNASHMSTDMGGRDKSMNYEKNPKGKERRIAPMKKNNEISRNIFLDPFFTENWEDMFNVGSTFNDIVHKARDITKSAMRAADPKKVDTSHPGSYTSKSFYRNYSRGQGQPEKREVISQETITNVDEKGRKFVERWKTHEHGNEKRTSHHKMIDDKGIKEMRKQLLDSGEEFEHIDYHKLNDREVHNFNSEFEKGLRHVREILPSQRMIGMPSTFKNMLPDPFSRSLRDMDRDFFSDHHNRYGLPMGDMGYDEYGTRSGEATRPQSSQLTDSGKGKVSSSQDNRGSTQTSGQGSTIRGR